MAKADYIEVEDMNGVRFFVSVPGIVMVRPATRDDPPDLTDVYLSNGLVLTLKRLPEELTALIGGIVNK